MASVGPAMLRTAGEVADGVRLHAFCTRKYFDNVIWPELCIGLERGGRVREHFQISFGGLIDAVSDSASYETPSDLPPQDIQGLAVFFEGFAVR